MQKKIKDDAISRQAAIDAIKKRADKARDMVGSDHPFWEGLIVALDIVEQLPSAQPERPKGHWVEIGDEPFDEWECDMCGFVIDGSGCIDPEEYRDVYKFCPNCGADMRGEKHETD